MPEYKHYNADLRTRLEAYRTKDRAQPLTMGSLAKELGVSGTRVNKYLLGKPEGDVASLEARVADLLKTVARRQVADLEPFDTNATRTLISTMELVRKTNDIGLLTGPAGVGKTVSIRMYCATNPTSLAICVPRWQRTEKGLGSLLFAACDTRDWAGNTPRCTYLATRLHNSNRLIIIDNAQRMTRGAREWMFDFHDATGCPIAMIGNPEVLQQIRRCDQHFSRIGVFREVALARMQISSYARRMVDAFVDDPAADLYGLALAVAEEKGHLRALRKQLVLMLDLLGTSAYKGNQARAFHAVHALLVRDYEI